MFKSEKFNQALRQNENFIDGTCLFNMCPNRRQDLFDDRFWVTELFDLNLPVRKIGVMVWDNKKERLHGPFALKNTVTKFAPNPNVHITQGNKVGVPQDLLNESTLGDYKFEKHNGGVDLYLYFDGGIDYCVTGFDKEKLTSELV